jgi:hypothetical protein
MEALSSSEPSLNTTRLHGIISQKAVPFTFKQFIQRILGPKKGLLAADIENCISKDSTYVVV